MIRLYEKENHAKTYAVYRPDYPISVAEEIISYVRRKSGLQKGDNIPVMVDIGCGTGQSTKLFQPYVSKIVSIDPSENQIEQAKIFNSAPNVTYFVGKAESMPVDDESVDIVCAGTSIHWVDFGCFFKECSRVLKPSGSIALYAYGKPNITQLDRSPDPSAASILSNLCSECISHERTSHVGDKYSRIFDMITCADKTRSDFHKIEKELSLEEFSKYASTWSSYHTFLKNKEDSQSDILKDFGKDLKKLWHVEHLRDDEIKLFVTWDVFILLSGRPWK
uniref:putative methyltransferase DDB_G0268948 n=1 Tax=Styela clava TaxID=7725 RepID=UPI00193A96E1|nr:putative methyltransferase DDB_G0268948 [Styela clava]